MVRLAKASDAEAIAALVNYYAERGHMLHRSLESVYESLRDFLVCTGANGLTGCAALSITWRDLAEVRSLAVAPERRRHGIGSRLVAAAVEQAKELGLGRIFVLTYEPKFFQRFGFRIVDKQSLPTKVWRDCIHCSHADDCRETAMLLELGRPHD